MSWKDIEEKWAAMARRVKSDQSQDGDDMLITRAPAKAPTEFPAPPSLDLPAK